MDLTVITPFLTVVPWSEPSLSQHSHHPGWHKAGLERGQGNSGEAEGEASVTHHLPTGPGHGQGDWSRQISRVLSSHAKRTQICLWWSHPCCAVSQTQAKEEESLHSTLRDEGRCPLPLLPLTFFYSSDSCKHFFRFSHLIFPFDSFVNDTDVSLRQICRQFGFLFVHLFVR